MAKYPFAEIVRKNMEESGIIILPDGSTTLKQPADADKELNKQANNNTEPTGDTEHKNSDDNPPVDEKDKILSLQREEIADLKAKLAQSNTQQSFETPPHKSARETELEKEIEDLKSKISTQTIAEQADEVRSLLEQQGFKSAISSRGGR